MSACVVCARALFFVERVVWPCPYCRPCAARLGLERLADVKNLCALRVYARGVPTWWRWTVWMAHAVAWEYVPG